MGFEISSDVKLKLGEKTTETTAGGGYTNLRLAFKKNLVKKPISDKNFPGVIFESFEFESGKDWIVLATNVRKTTIEEAADETFGLDAMDSTLNFEAIGDEEQLRNLINDGLNSADVYILLDHCKLGRTYSFGNGDCCPAMIKIGFSAGAEAKDGRRFTGKIMVQDGGVVPIYKGLGSLGYETTVPADTEEIDVSNGEGTYNLPSNTAATAITGLTGAVVGKVYSLYWKGTTNRSTIADGATFHLASAFTPATGARLMLRALKANEFVEIARYIPD